MRWRPRKRNERGHIDGLLLTFVYEGNLLRDVVRQDDDETTREWLLAELSRGSRAVAELAAAVHEGMENPAAGELERIKERLGRSLRRMSADGLVEKRGNTGIKVLWALKERP